LNDQFAVLSTSNYFCIDVHVFQFLPNLIILFFHLTQHATNNKYAYKSKIIQFTHIKSHLIKM